METKCSQSHTTDHRYNNPRCVLLTLFTSHSLFPIYHSNPSFTYQIYICVKIPCTARAEPSGCGKLAKPDIQSISSFRLTEGQILDFCKATGSVQEQEYFGFWEVFGCEAQHGDVVFCVVDGDITRDQPPFLKPPQPTSHHILRLGLELLCFSSMLL